MSRLEYYNITQAHLFHQHHINTAPILYFPLCCSQACILFGVLSWIIYNNFLLSWVTLCPILCYSSIVLCWNKLVCVCVEDIFHAKVYFSAFNPHVHCIHNLFFIFWHILCVKKQLIIMNTMTPPHSALQQHYGHGHSEAAHHRSACFTQPSASLMSCFWVCWVIFCDKTDQFMCAHRPTTDQRCSSVWILLLLPHIFILHFIHKLPKTLPSTSLHCIALHFRMHLVFGSAAVLLWSDVATAVFVKLQDSHPCLYIFLVWDYHSAFPLNCVESPVPDEWVSVWKKEKEKLVQWQNQNQST